MRRAVLAMAVVAVLGGSAAARDFRAGKDKFLHGDYEGAAAELATVRGKHRDEARLLLARVELRTGAYDAAEKRARELLKSKHAADAGALLGEIHLLRGRYREAVKHLEGVVAKHPSHLRARYLLGLAYRHVGKRDEASETFDQFYFDYESRKLDDRNPEHLMYLGQSGRYTEQYQLGNEAFREAVALDPLLLEANVEWGYMFLEKYHAGHAEESFDEVLKTDPRHPDAHAGMAIVRIEQSYDVAAARHHIDQALAVNPRHLGALLVRAQLEIDARAWPAARATLDEVFAVNPEHPEARALLATIYWLRDDAKGFERERNRVLAINPSYAEFFHIVGEAAVREHRYREAIALEERGVALDPKYYVGMAAIGIGYLRQGDEAKGVEWLRKAWEGDQYNVRTLNMLDLFEEVIPKDYVFSTSKHFKVRYHKAERKLLARYVEPLLERAYASMVKRYGFTPSAPIVIELYQQPEHYSVRTVGLPNLGALGVCFGQVITAMSPSGGNINWAQVLWHELGHVFAIQMSKSRVPRWYTEGLSEYETVIARPEWRREHDRDVYEAMTAGRLPSVVDLDQGFVKPDMQEVLVAYYLSSLVIEYIADTYGFPKVVEGLKLYGRGLETPAVIEKITGLAPAKFDAAFRAHLDKRLAVYRGSFNLPSTGYGDLPALEAAATAAPEDAGAQAALGLGYFYAGDARRTREVMTKVLQLDGDNHYALFVLGELALMERDVAGAKGYYDQLIAAGGDGYEVRGRLGLIAQRRGDDAEAITQLELAKKRDPQRSEPYIMLAEIYERAGRPDDALREYERYVMLEQMQYGPVRELVTKLVERKQWAKARQYGELAVNIVPHDGELLLMLGRAYLETKAPKLALYTYDSALAVEPAIRRPALAHLGRARAYLALGDKRKARTALEAAERLEPTHPDLKPLRAKL